MQKPGWVSVLEGQGECGPEERSLSGAVVSAFAALLHTLVQGEASLQDIQGRAGYSWVEVGQTGSDAEKASHVEKHKDDKYFQHFLWYYMTDIT